jgi:hypothetical protein
MPPFDDQTHGLRHRALRYRELARLSQDGEMGGRLRALAAELERQIERSAELSANAIETRRRTAMLLAQLDAVLGLVRQALFSTSRQLCASRFSAEDLREESRLCREEAVAVADVEARRALAGRALDFAMIGEQLARNGRGPA